jgi:hypothetical protein
VASVFFVMAMGFFLALAINVGRLTRTRGDLQHAADSAALAAAAQLDDTHNESGHGGDLKRGPVDFDPTPDTSSPAWAQRFATTYRLTTGTTVSFDRLADLQFGFWHDRAEHCAFGSGSCVQGFEEATSLTTPTTVAGLADLVTINAVRAKVSAPLPNVLRYFAGVANPTVRAVSVATTRRSGAACPLPVAIPTCRPPQDAAQHNETPIDWGAVSVPNQPATSAGELTCSAGFDEIEFFSGALNVQPIGGSTEWKQAAPSRMDVQVPTSVGNFGNPLTLARLDLLGEHRGLGMTDDLAQYVRDKTSGVIGCGPIARTGYPAGSYATSTGTEGSLAPLIDGLLGIEAGVKMHACRLGQRFMLPLVKPANNNCSLWPSASPTAGDDLVVGFVEVLFETVRCAGNSGGTFLSIPGSGGPMDCETNVAAAQSCTQPQTGPSSDGYLQVHVQYRCRPDPEIGPIPNSRSRLVQ